MQRPERGPIRRKGRRGVPLFLLWFLTATGIAQVSEDWADSPEAYFLTPEERRGWKTLDSGAARDRFKDRYWLTRDPTSSTEKNEFRDTILDRIKVADARFPIGKTPGSRTRRGLKKMDSNPQNWMRAALSDIDAVSSRRASPFLPYA